MKLIIQEDIKNVNWEDMQKVYLSVGWVKHSPDVIEKIFMNSNVAVIVKSEEQIVGFGRAITDGVFNAAIYDVVVHKDFQGKGIAKQILTALLKKLEGISCIHLISTTGNELFYRKMGFKHLKTGMAIYTNPALDQEYLE
ncbi:GNAT family N-acetyltransferase [Bacillus sp. FJAT-49736]|uniref:GNAT family N-acetyltransferase n=1 Tax=Bacillus sp. FJAT-49736 TaxID=2833582 RepID=UPI001BC930F5|nr:GNAT family N-acetyltransferase [Bacillus sp. FJAT-49736]MBS4172949.1 GNAT family N-acetyltransferase [Bacillus sp. FJAT-49736]